MLGTIVLDPAMFTKPVDGLDGARMTEATFLVRRQVGIEILQPTFGIQHLEIELLPGSDTVEAVLSEHPHGTVVLELVLRQVHEQVVQLADEPDVDVLDIVLDDLVAYGIAVPVRVIQMSDLVDSDCSHDAVLSI